IVLFALTACNNSQTNRETHLDKRISLRADTLNVVSMTDTLVIFESVCRGCAYEASTEFSISDSLGIIKLVHIESYDNNPPETDGGQINKNLILLPEKPGTTTIKMYKFWEQPYTAEDSALFTSYTIKVKN
ncbi:MAG TPA: hypothetical protein VN451_07600, partial [Chitinophagaceae bacterium]|nr:hypothetical protein [Chitinophagaceae bacterium]